MFLKHLETFSIVIRRYTSSLLAECHLTINNNVDALMGRSLLNNCSETRVLLNIISDETIS